MYDVAMELSHTPGALARMGEVLGQAGISIEGGGAFVVDGTGIAHFLFNDGQAAVAALETAGITVIACQPVVMLNLRQDVPGQLGALTRHMGEAGINIEVLYSDHAHQLILVVDDAERAQQVASRWMADTWAE